MQILELANDTFYVAAIVLLLAKLAAIPRFIVLLAVVYTLKLLSARERPDSTDLKSFPSGHAAVAWYLAGAYQFNPFVVAWATIVSYARVYARKHWPLDVLVGAAIGIAIAYI